MSERSALSGRAAIAGIGATEFSKDSGRSELRLAASIGEKTLPACPLQWPAKGFFQYWTALKEVTCHLPAYRSHLVSGVMEPPGFRRNGATSFSAYWSHPGLKDVST